MDTIRCHTIIIIIITLGCTVVLLHITRAGMYTEIRTASLGRSFVGSQTTIMWYAINDCMLVEGVAIFLLWNFLFYNSPVRHLCSVAQGVVLVSYTGRAGVPCQIIPHPLAQNASAPGSRNIFQHVATRRLGWMGNWNPADWRYCIFYILENE